MEPTFSRGLLRPQRKRKHPEPVEAPSTKQAKTRVGRKVQGRQTTTKTGVATGADTGVSLDKRPVSSLPSGTIIFKNLQNMEQVLQARKTCDEQQRVTEGSSKLVKGEKGAFAARGFKKGELIGFYEGKRVFRKRVPVLSAGRRRKRHRGGVTKLKKKQDLFIVWQRERNSIQLLQRPDRHVAWTGAQVYRTGVEVGIDAAQGGGDIRFINHHEEPNVVLETVVNTEELASQGAGQGGKLYLKRNQDQFDDDSVLVAAYARKPVTEGEELVCNYKRHLLKGPVEFEQVGSNIAVSQEGQVEIDGFTVRFLGNPESFARSNNQDTSSSGNSEDMEVEPTSEASLPKDDEDSHLDAVGEIDDWLEALGDDELRKAFDEEVRHLLTSGEPARKLVSIARDNMSPRVSDEALRAYLVLNLLRYEYHPEVCIKMLRILSQSPPINDYGDPGQKKAWSTEVIFQMMLDYEVLSNEDALRIMPIAWVKKHPQYTEDFICYCYLEGRFQGTLLPKLHEFGLKTPSGESWTQKTVDALLSQRGLLNPMGDTELGNLVKKHLKGDTLAHIQLLQQMRGGDQCAFCAYVIAELENKKVKSARDSQELPKVIAHLNQAKVEVPVAGGLYAPQLDTLLVLARECPNRALGDKLFAELLKYEQIIIDGLKAKNPNWTREWLKRIGNPVSRAMLYKLSPDRPAKMLQLFLTLKPMEKTRQRRNAVAPLGRQNIPKTLEVPADETAWQQLVTSKPGNVHWVGIDAVKFLESMGEDPGLEGRFGRPDLREPSEDR